jgi:hypothetical protein
MNQQDTAQLVWIDPAGNEYSVIRTSGISAAGTFDGYFVNSGVRGVFHMRDCRTA